MTGFHETAAGERIGVVLLGMGGPAAPGDVEPFLESLFSDPAILPLPDAVRLPLARRIARKRGPRARERYGLIGGASPIHAFTEAQVRELSDLLGEGYEVRHAFRYVRPRAAEVCEDLASRGVARVIGLSTYPQRSFTTIDSSVADLWEASTRHGIRVSVIPSYPVDAGFVGALAVAVRGAIGQAGRDAHVVMAAHAVPRRSVRRGDPYVSEVERSARALARSLPPDVRWHLAYQSRVGPVGWVGPSLEETLARLGGSGASSVVVVPLSFTSEHLETLVELDLEVREIASRHGIGTYVRAPVPGMHPLFISMLGRLVRQEVARA